MLRKILVFIFALLCFTLSGCATYKEIDRGYLVTTIGVQKTSDKATIFIEALVSSDISNEKNKRIVLKGAGRDERHAYSNLKSMLVKPLYFEQLGTIVVDEQSNIDFLKDGANLNLGVYLVKTSDVTSLFENYTSSGVIGYDIIALVKTQQKENNQKINNQLYNLYSDEFTIPIVNLTDGNLILKTNEE